MHTSCWHPNGNTNTAHKHSNPGIQFAPNLSTRENIKYSSPVILFVPNLNTKIAHRTEQSWHNPVCAKFEH
jgi:hypothetical protein